jgi:SAM-dependent methyltransferase
VAPVAQGDGLLCPCCRVVYPVRHDAGFVDLVPRARVGAVTQYADHEFRERLAVTDAPPVLSARVKADMMRRMLAPGGGERVLDLGCGPGKLALYAGVDGARPAGLDVAPFFLARAVRDLDLALGDLRRLPFRKGSFPRAYSLDVLEHLEEEEVRDVLVEARRVAGPAGRLFVYTHAMESSRLARFQRAVNNTARRLGQAGLLDHETEALRKSDHKNAIRSHEHFDEICAAAGLEVLERRYYNVVFKAVVEDLLLKLWKGRRRPAGTPPPTPSPPPLAPGETGYSSIRGEGAAAARPLPPSPPPQSEDITPRTVGAPPPGRLVLAVALALTWLLKLDVVLFGAIRTGPFFGLLRPVPRSPAATNGATEAVAESVSTR